MSGTYNTLGEMKKVYNILEETFQGKQSEIWKDNIKIDLE
jgi:hypothetical protein